MGSKTDTANGYGNQKGVVAKSVVEARLPGTAKHRAATESKLVEPSGEFPDVAKSLGISAG